MADRMGPTLWDPPGAPILLPLSSRLSAASPKTPKQDPVVNRDLVPGLLYPLQLLHPVRIGLQVLDHFVHHSLLLYQHCLQLGLVVPLM